MYICHQYMPSLVEIMAWCLFRTKQLFWRVLDYYQLSTLEHISYCKMSAILSQCVNKPYMLKFLFPVKLCCYHGCWPLVPCVDRSSTVRLFIPPETKFSGGILDSPCSSVRLSVCLSVRPSVRPWVGVRMITLILFSGFKNFCLHISLGSRSCMGLNISVLPH